MTTTQCAAICEQRLRQWRDKMIREHATPALLIGVGHDKASGAITLHCTEDLSNDELRAILLLAAKQIPADKTNAKPE